MEADSDSNYMPEGKVAYEKIRGYIRKTRIESLTLIENQG